VNLDALEERQLVAFIVIAGCFGALLAIHFQVELSAIRREIRLLRRQVRRGPMSPATRAGIPDRAGPPPADLKKRS